MKNIILGSAGWREKYAGKIDILSDNEISNFLQEISKRGINHIDTAPSYGDAEELIFQFAKPSMMIDTKLDPFKDMQDFERQLNKLKNQRINIIYFHDPEIVKNASEDELNQYFKSIQKLNCKMGFSLYEIENLKLAYSIFADNEDVVFQVPVNILDLKFLNFVIKHNIKLDRVIVRSIFSRGLIFQDDAKIPSCFGDKYLHVKEVFESEYQTSFCQQSLHELTFSLVSFLNKINIKTLFGVHNIEEVNVILENIQKNMQRNFNWDDMIYKSKTISKIEDLIL